MARNLKTDKQIDDFVAKVLVEANHHAPQVESVIQSLSDAVRSRVTLGVDRIEVYERNGKIARTCWVTINKNRHVFTYNYGAKKIDLRTGGLQGPTAYQFDDSTPINVIRSKISKL
jgi:hypothetical protein